MESQFLNITIVFHIYLFVIRRFAFSLHNNLNSVQGIFMNLCCTKIFFLEIKENDTDNREGEKLQLLKESILWADHQRK